MTNVLSRFMTKAHAEQFVIAFCLFLTLCVFGFLAIVTFLADS